MSPIALLLNLLWIVFGGVWMAVGWVVAAAIMALTIIGLPWARAAAIQLRRNGTIYRQREENHEAARFHRWSDVRGRNGTGTGTADWESLPDRIV